MSVHIWNKSKESWGSMESLLIPLLPQEVSFGKSLNCFCLLISTCLSKSGLSNSHLYNRALLQFSGSGHSCVTLDVSLNSSSLNFPIWKPGIKISAYQLDGVFTGSDVTHLYRVASVCLGLCKTLQGKEMNKTQSRCSGTQLLAQWEKGMKALCPCRGLPKC